MVSAARPARAADTAAPAVTAAALPPMLSAPEADLYQQRLQRILYRQRWALATSLYRIADYQGAAAYLMALVNEPLGEGSLYEARFRLAESLFHVGAWPGSAYWFRRVLEMDRHGKHASRAAARLADIAVRMGELDEAQTWFARADVPGEERSMAAYGLGRALYAGNVTDARRYLGEVAPGSRFHAEALFHLGTIEAVYAGNVTAAIRLFQAADAALPAALPERGPGSGPEGAERLARFREIIALSTARIYADAGRAEEALAAYDRVPGEGRYADAALLESAWVLLRSDNVLSALERVRRLLEEHPQSPRVLEASLLVGYLTIEQRRFNQAYGHFEDTRVLMERLVSQLQRYAVDVTSPEIFYARLVESERGVTLPTQIGLWVREGEKVREAATVIDEVTGLEETIRDLYRELDQLEVLAASQRGTGDDPAALENTIRLELSDALYSLQERILELRLRPFIKRADPKELEVLRSVRRIRNDLASFRYTPADVASETVRRQQTLGALAQYLLQIHPEIGLDTARGADARRIAEVDRPLWADEYLMKARRNLVELTREASLDDRWIDAALEYTIYVEDRLQGLIFRRQRVTERYDFVRQAGILFRQSVELQQALRDLGNAVADIQEHIYLGTRARAEGERVALTRYRFVARDIAMAARTTRGVYAQEEFGRVRERVAGTAARADLGALDTAWRVKELEDERVRELLTEKQDRLVKLKEYYDDTLATRDEAGPWPGVEDFSPEALARETGSVDSSYGRELLTLGSEVVALAKALQEAQLQLEKLQGGAESAVMTEREREPRETPLEFQFEPVVPATDGGRPLNLNPQEAR